MKYSLLLLSFGIFMSTHVDAHSDKVIQQLKLERANACSNQQSVLLGKINLTSGTFKYLRSEGNDTCEPNNNGIIQPKMDCGQFDDWQLAFQLGNKMCRALKRNMLKFDNTIQPEMRVFSQFEAPYEFKGPNHHIDYSGKLGISLACYICDPYQE